MSTLNVMKQSDKGIQKSKGNIHVPTKQYFNEGRTIRLDFFDDFSTLGIMKSGVDGDSLSKIFLSKENAKQLLKILGEGML